MAMTLSEAGTATARSLPGRLLQQSRRRPDEPAIREKRLGRWQERTWAEYQAAVAEVACALLQLGVEAGDTVAILSENRQEWLYADLATQAIGAISVGIYPTCPANEVAYQLAHSGAVVLFAEDQEQVDKAVACRSQTPDVRHVVVLDPRGVRGYGDDRLRTWEDVLETGRAAVAARPEEVERRTLALDPAAPAMIVYTSGTTGTPKGAVLSHRNVTASADLTAGVLNWTTGDTVLSYLPLCHVAEKILSLYLPLTAGSVVHFGESIDTVQSDLQEVSPTGFLGVPRIWEKMFASVDIRLQDTSRTKAWLARHFLPPLASVAEQQVPAPGRLRRYLGELLVHRPLRERLGLQRCRLAMAGGAPIDPQLLAWFRGIGVPTVEGYGQTETSGMTHINLNRGLGTLGTVGPVLPGVECRIAGDGEILLRHDAIVFSGYLHDREATARTVVDGWLHSGDLGEVDEDGYLTITGRKKQIIITAGGKNLSPARIENALKASPYVREAVAIGDRRRFVSALIQIEYDRVADWATRRGLTHTSFSDLAANEEVRALVAAEVERANEQLARVEWVRAFRLLEHELHQDDDELTATQKVRRSVVEERYAALIEGMYH